MLNSADKIHEHIRRGAACGIGRHPPTWALRAGVITGITLLGAGVVLAANPGATVNPAGEATGLAAVRTTDVAQLLLYVFLALFVSFLCSVAEAVLLSITPSHIAGLGEHQPKLAALLRRLRQENVDQSLAAILTLNTIAHTAGAIAAGAKATVVFGSAWFGVFSAVMTLLILFLSEIVPKTLGAVYWPQLARPTAHFLRVLIVVMRPLLRVMEYLTRWIARRHKAPEFSRQEFLAMTHLGEQVGHLKADESRIIRNLFQFESLRARDIMTPRTVIVALQQDVTVARALQSIDRTPFSRLPVYGTNLDDVTGFVLKQDLLLAQIQGGGANPVSRHRREIHSVTEEMPLSALLEFLLDRRQHIALVVDEYGGTEGLVTLEDVVETLLGLEIVDEADTTEDMQALARRLWTRRAKALGLDVD